MGTVGSCCFRPGDRYSDANEIRLRGLMAAAGDWAQSVRVKLRMRKVRGVSTAVGRGGDGASLGHGACGKD